MNIPVKYKQKSFWVETFWAYVYLLPVFIILGVFVFYPVFKSFFMSFTEWDMIGTQKFVGLENYQDLFKDRLFRKSLINTSYFVFFSVPLTMLISLFIAILLNTKIKARSWFRIAFFIPWITSPVAATMVWKWIFNYNSYGLLNYFLLKATELVNWFAYVFTFGNAEHWLTFAPLNWLNNPSFTIPNLIILSVWKMMGYNIVIFLAGLQNVPNELYEAAQVDGASRWDKFRHITLPLISPTTFFISIISIIGAFKIFTQVFVLYEGTPGMLNSGLTVVFYIYTKAFNDWRMGYASAGSYILFFIIFIFTLIQMRLSKKRVHYS
ncbi:MAG: sugar ABC transporter permease [Halanaerobiales bacterium]|nr:sugar ABC transporter permease [Halanaerobiales bacterium]